MAAREDGQEAHPQRACTNLTNYTDQAAAAFERWAFWLLFVPATKSNIPLYGPYRPFTEKGLYGFIRHMVETTNKH